jgi:hypothetical protein
MWLELLRENNVRIEIEDGEEPVEKPTADELDEVGGKTLFLKSVNEPTRPRPTFIWRNATH